MLDLLEIRRFMMCVTCGSISADFVIGAPNVLVSETCQCTATLGGTAVTSASWSVMVGQQYATINNTGLLTVLSWAHDDTVVLAATFNGTSAYHTMTVTYKSGASSESETETHVDESGNTTTTTTTTTVNDDGSSSVETETVIADESGNTIGTENSMQTNNPDGSYDSTSTRYDENGEPTDTINISGDTDGNVNTQDVEYKNGEPVVTAYTIDTSGNPDGEKTYNSDGVNTEFIPFDGTRKGFELHIRFKSTPSEQPNPPFVVDTEDTGSNYLFNIFSAQDPFKPWPGFMLRWALAKNNYTSSSGGFIFQYIASDGRSNNISITKPNSSVARTGLFDLTVIYDPDLTKYNNKFIITNNLTSTVLKAVDVEFGDNDLDFTIGYAISQVGTPYRYAKLSVYEFSITQI